MKKKFGTLLLSMTLTLSLLLSGFISTGAEAATSTATANTTASSQKAGKNPFTGSVYTHNAMHDGKNIFLGIDVSYYQGSIDWEKVKAAGVQFVILRLGYRGYLTGDLSLDKNFRTYAQGAADAGIPIGAYFYTEAINENEAALEAAYCVEQLKDFNVALPIAYDYEPSTQKNGRLYKANLSKSKATNLCKSFCATIKAAGYTPMIYANKSDLTTKIDGAALGESYKIWLANYTTKTTYTGNYDFWQYSSAGKVNGISGSVDCNFWYTANNTPFAADDIKISGATIASIAKQTYNGKPKTPAVKVSYEGKTLVNGTDYTVSYSNNVNIGKASVKITGIGDYSGTKTVSFQIIPAKVKGFKKGSTTAQKTIVLNWTSHAQATGYLIYRKTTLNGTSYKKIGTIKTNKTTTFTDTKRTANRTYYYAVRAYTTVSGTNYYSDYSYVSAAANPAVKTQTLTTDTKLYQEPDTEDTENTEQLTMPAGAKITHLGKVYITSKKTSYYVKYSEDGVTYKGYVPGDTGFE